jgi:hypothetical protein
MDFRDDVRDVARKSSLEMEMDGSHLQLVKAEGKYHTIEYLAME